MASSAGPQTTIPPDAEPNSSSIAAGEILYHALQQLHRDHPARQRIEGAQRTALTNLESSVEQLKNFSVASDALFQSCSASFPNHLHFLSQIKKDLNHLEAKVTWLKMRACRIAEHDGVDLSFLDGEPTTTAATTTTTATSANATNNNNNVINPNDDEVLSSMQQEEHQEGPTAALPVTPLPNQDVAIISAPHSNAASSVDASEGQKGEEEVDLPPQQQNEAEAAAADDGEKNEEEEEGQEGGGSDGGVVEDDETALEAMDEAVAKSADEATD